MKKSDRESLDILLKNYNPKADGLIKYKEWKEKYLDELLDFKYIHTIDDFKKLNLGGVIKVITLSNEELKKGGILVKISTDTKNKLYALLSIPNKKYIWKIYFNNSYIFYRPPYNSYINDDKTEAFKNMMDKFVSKEEINQYTTEDSRDNKLNDLFKRYNKK